MKPSTCREYKNLRRTGGKDLLSNQGLQSKVNLSFGKFLLESSRFRMFCGDRCHYVETNGHEYIYFPVIPLTLSKVDPLCDYTNVPKQLARARRVVGMTNQTKPQHSMVLTTKSSSLDNVALPKVLHGWELPWYKSPSSHKPKLPLNKANDN